MIDSVGEFGLGQPILALELRPPPCAQICHRRTVRNGPAREWRPGEQRRDALGGALVVLANVAMRLPACERCVFWQELAALAESAAEAIANHEDPRDAHA